MGNMVINSKEYWEKRFACKDWGECNGPQQTIFFAELFMELCPSWVKKFIDNNCRTIVDLGCAEGDGTKVLKQYFSGSCVAGIDFAESAIEHASTKYPDINYQVGNILDLDGKWDAIYLSNVLEHFPNPKDVLSSVSKHAKELMLVLVPFEEIDASDEHDFRFTYDNIPVCIGDFYLVSSEVGLNQGEKSFYLGQEILLVYSRNVELNKDVTIQRSNDVVRRLVNEGDYENYKAKYIDLGANFKDMREKAANYEEELIEVKTKLYSESNERLVAENRIGSLETELIEVKNKLYSESNERLVAENKIVEIENELIEVKMKLSSETNENVVLQNELLAVNNRITELENKIKTIESEKESIRIERDKLQFVYDDLYRYSYYQDQKLNNILESKAYQLFEKWLHPVLRFLNRVVRKIGRIIKALISLNFSGVKYEIVKPIKNRINVWKGKKAEQAVFDNLQKSIREKIVVVFPPTLDWDMELFQRPQQLAMAYAKKSGVVVVYLTANMKYDNVANAVEVMDDLWIVNNLFCERVNDILAAAKSVVLSISWTQNKIYLEKIKANKLIYEYIDEICIFDGYDENMERDHRFMMKQADVTVCTASKLFKQAEGIASNPILSPNAGDYEFFASTKDVEVNPIIEDIVGDYDVVLGYYGALAEWFDYNLIKEVALRHSNWLWILVGMDYDGTLGKSGILELKNVKYVGPQPYKMLPSFLKAFDIATIPFLINEITLSTSPVKLFEYMAAQKPILTSKMPECLKYESVKTYSDISDFEHYVENLVKMDSEGDKYYKLLEKDAINNTWEARTDEILVALGEK